MINSTKERPLQRREGASPRVFVVVLAWNHRQDTAECLRSVFQMSYPPTQVVVVDNHSTDDTPRWIRAHFPEVSVICCSENLGFAGGMNRGIVYALEHEAEYVLLLNNDTILDHNTLDRLMETAARMSRAGVWVPKICYWEEQKRIWAAGARWRTFPPMVTMIGFRALDAPRYNQPHEVDLATGCALLVQRRVFERVGLFDPGFFMYHEDYEFCCRVRAAGFQIWYVPEAWVWHKVSQSAGEGSPFKWFYWAKSIVRFYRLCLNHPMLSLLAVSIWVLIRELLKGHVAFVPHYWRGMMAGWGEMSRKTG